MQPPPSNTPTSATGRSVGYLRRSSSSGVVSSVISGIATVVFLPLIIDTVGMEAYGIWATLAIFTGGANIATLDLDKSVVFHLARAGVETERSAIYSAALTIQLVTISAIVVAYGIGTALDANPFSGVTGVSPKLGRIILASGVVITCLSIFTHLQRALLEASYGLHLVNIGFMLQTVGTYAALYLISRHNSSVEGMLLCTVGTYMCLSILHWWQAHRVSAIPLQRPALRTICRMLRYSLAMFAASAMSIVILPLSRYLFIQTTGDPTLYGVFDASLKVAFFGLALMASFSRPLLVLFSELGHGGLAQVRRLLNRYTLGLAGCYGAACLGFIVLGERVAARLFPSHSTSLYTTTRLLLFGVLLFGIADPYIRSFIGLGRLRLMLLIRILQPTTNFVLLAALASMPALDRFATAFSMAWGVTAVAFILIHRALFRVQNLGEKVPSSLGS